MASTQRVPFSTVCGLPAGSADALTTSTVDSILSGDDGISDGVTYGSYSQLSSSSVIPTYEFPISYGAVYGSHGNPTSAFSGQSTFSPELSSSSSSLLPQEQLAHTLTISSGTKSQAFASDDFVSHSISLPTGTNSQGYVSGSRSVPSVPPPLIPHFSSPTDDSPFTLTFITGIIRICRGCRQKFVKPPVPPSDLCVHHQEWQEFTPVGGSAVQRRYGNVYYHCNLPCILARCLQFTPSMLVIPMPVLVQLLPIHTAYLQKQMPGRLASN